MAVIVCNISALEYWRCPPIVRDAEVPLGVACAPRDAGGLGFARSTFFPRTNAREAERLIPGRLLTDLKGVSLPVHVMVDGTARRSSTELIAYHRMPATVSRENIIQLGNGLSVLSPLAALVDASQKQIRTHIARVACECCGIYACHRDTLRSNFVLNELLATHELERIARQARRSLSDYLESKNDPPWIPSLANTTRSASLWRRPPLFSKDELQSFTIANSSLRGSKPLYRALDLVQDGLASPLETQSLIMACSDSASGGQGLPVPEINKRIPLSNEARKLYPFSNVYADGLWENNKTIFEANGKAFHADDKGFLIQSGRTSALKLMGYKIHELNYAQLKDPDQFAAIMKTLAEDIGATPPRRTAAFLARESKLRFETLQRTPFTN